jgi:Zn-dependent alcohol dehydrogenase
MIEITDSFILNRVPSRSFDACILVNQNEPLVVDRISFSDELSPGQVLVKVISTAICGSQVGEISGIKGNDPYLPHLLGHEALVQIENSMDCPFLEDGDFAIAHWISNSGRSGGPVQYSRAGAVVNAGEIATFTQYALISESRLTRIPSSILDTFSTNLLATIGCSFLTANGVIRNDLGITNTQEMLLIGAGGVCQAMIALLASLGTYNVTVVDPSEIRRNYVRRLGVQKVYAHIDELRSSNQRFSSVVDFTGRSYEIEQGYDYLSDTGVLALVGVSKYNQRVSINPMPLHYGRKIVGVFGGQAKPSEDIPFILSELSKIKEILEALEYKTMSLNEINSGVDLVSQASFPGRIILEPFQ